MNKIKFSLFAVIFLCAINFYAQNPKKVYKTGTKLLEDKKYTEAIVQFNSVIELDAAYTNAYIARAKAYEKTDKINKAIDDYLKVINIDSRITDAYYNAGRLYYTQEKYEDALKMLNEATLLDSKSVNALQYKIYTLIKLEDYSNAVIESNKALELSNNCICHYTHGVASDSLGKYNDAQTDYNKVISLNPDYTKAYVALTYVYLKLDKLDDALNIANKAVEKFTEETDVYLARSKVFYKRSDFPSAINDLSKIIVLNPTNELAILLRGIYYQEFNQHQNAITDFSKVILINENNPLAYYKRAISNEEITNYDVAIADFVKFLELAENNKVNEKFIADTKKKLFELNRESDKPEIVLSNPVEKVPGIVRITGISKKVMINGQVEDASNTEYIKIDGNSIKFSKNEQNKDIFEYDLVVEGKSQFSIEVSDVYNNITLINYAIERTEADPPKVTLIKPYASDNGEIYLESNNPTLFIEGRISDENRIKSILIEDVTASYIADEINPSFTATIDITNKNKITIKAIDIYDNEFIMVYVFNREGADLSESNPMGKTWVIFIDNSNYETFASLEGPAKDVSSMKSALNNYQIHNMIHKKDMTKRNLEKFFSIELRDLVKNNNVNSLLIWYAGHGKFINETGYWIPVDAVRDDEFTYFNINSLKASMQSYSKYLTHTLVVTDACESGPSFYQAMRSTPKIRSCDDWKATKFKSSQVFSSAGYELAVDNSQFTKTFAKSLIYNTNACIPIESIVLKVTEAVQKNNNQAPQFGKIAGFEDENGTFFFMKKE
ncbi:MAG: caspase family protein [Bacteroidales bacterium]|nr:caspase family protein [Bacteroidales bacterium]